MLWAVKEKVKPAGRLTARQRARNHRSGKVRAKVEMCPRREVREATGSGHRGIEERGEALAVGARQTCIPPAGNLRPPDDTRPSGPAPRRQLAALTRKNVRLSLK